MEGPRVEQAQRVFLAMALADANGLELGDVLKLARLADRAGLDLLITGHPGLGPPRTDPLSLASALIAVTKEIGLAAGVMTSNSAPFHTARAFASFDLLSRGRAGWLTEPGPDAGGFELSRHQEHLEVAFALFDSWEDEALVLDKVKSVFTDPSLVHRISHQGLHFTVDGPLNTPRPLQGRPVILQHWNGFLGGVGEVALIEADAIGVMAKEAAKARAAAALVFADLPLKASGAGGRSVAPWAASSRALAQFVAEWTAEGVCHGFTLITDDPRSDLEWLIGETLPELEALGLRPKPVAGDLRSRLGLSRPLNRFTGLKGRQSK